MPAPPPTPYTRSFDFSDYQSANPTQPYPGAQDDVQFDALKVTTDSIIAALGDVRRSDGAIANQSVTPDSLSQGVLNLMGGYNVRGAWVTATTYAVKDVVTEGTSTYLCTAAHTSAALFATDLAANKWALIATSGGVSYTTVAEATAIAEARIYALAVPISGGVDMTGDLGIAKGSPRLVLSKAASGQSAKIVGSIAGNARWHLDLGSAHIESGGDAGSRFTVGYYTDAGVGPTTVLSINRNTPIFTVSAPVALSAATAAGQAPQFEQVQDIMIGMLADFACIDANIPAGWLLCDGRNVSRTTYAKLFAKIGTTYGVGDGSTTFTLPDLRGRARFGKDDMGGSAASRVTNAVSGITGTTLGATGGDQRLHSHTHSITDPGHTHTVTGGDTLLKQSPGGANDFSASGNWEGDATPSLTLSSATTGITIANGGSGTAQNMPPTMIVNVAIYAGTFG